MNDFMRGQIRNLIRMIEHTEKTMEFASMQDDGIISRREEKEIRKLKEINQKYIKELMKHIDK